MNQAGYCLVPLLDSIQAKLGRGTRASQRSTSPSTAIARDGGRPQQGMEVGFDDA